MIDNEMRRLYQKQETQSQWEARQRALQAEIHVIPDNYNFDAEFDDSSSSVVVQGFTTSGVDRSTTISGRTRRRDEKMVENDPMRYCADRCVSTGNCDVFEDMFDMVSCGVLLIIVMNYIKKQTLHFIVWLFFWETFKYINSSHCVSLYIYTKTKGS